MKFTTPVVIGLEIHAELDTRTKLFCSCSTKCDGNDEPPNSRVCPICLGHPGARPVLNRKVIDYAIRLCLALGSKISPEVIFSRKNYFYPDMSKNFQITQYEKPIGEGGFLEISGGKKIYLTRVHIEEDPASIVYPGTVQSSQYCMVDYNRCGNPLLEIVTEPQLENPKEAREFMNRLSSILTYLGIFDPLHGTMKADCNVSVEKSGYTRVEIKNISGFKEIERALTYEITRQKTYLRRGLLIKMETRGWDPQSKTTKSQRSKETEAEYGYIIEPDIPIYNISEEEIASVKDALPELAHQKRERFISRLGIDEGDAIVLSSDKGLADFFESVSEKVSVPIAAKWIRRELLRVMNYAGKNIYELGFGPKEVVEILSMVSEKTISEKTGQKLMEKLMEEKFSPKKYVEKQGLGIVGDSDEIEILCKRAIDENEKAVEDYNAGEEKAMHFLFGQVIRMSKGKADPGLVKEILKRLLG